MGESTELSHVSPIAHALLAAVGLQSEPIAPALPELPELPALPELPEELPLPASVPQAASTKIAKKRFLFIIA
jgi:hypothetical protein